MSVHCDSDKQQPDRWTTALSPGKSAGWPQSQATSRALQEGTLAWVETHSGPQDSVHSWDLCSGLLFLTIEFWGA